MGLSMSCRPSPPTNQFIACDAFSIVTSIFCLLSNISFLISYQYVTNTPTGKASQAKEGPQYKLEQLAHMCSSAVRTQGFTMHDLWNAMPRHPSESMPRHPSDVASSKAASSKASSKAASSAGDLLTIKTKFL